MKMMKAGLTSVFDNLHGLSSATIFRLSGETQLSIKESELDNHSSIIYTT